MDHSRTVLIIDDERDIQTGLGRILRGDGFNVETAGSVAETLARTEWDHIDVIILDRKLVDGVAEGLLPQFREFAPEASVVMITGYADMESSIHALREGVEDYLIKPVNPQDLRNTLLRILRLKEAEARAAEAERLALIGQMMTVLAHESGNALARAQACLEMLSLEIEGNAEASSLIARIGKAHQDLRLLYEEVRSFAAPINLQCAEWNLDGIWRQAWNNLRAAGQDKQGELKQEIEGVNLACAVDSFRMEQVFRNLFENAFAACGEPVEVVVRASEVELEGRPAVRVVIQDNGPGLREDQRQKVFEPFFTTKQKGTGLGLSIVRRIVEAHNGEISLGESEGCGAVFVLTLPRTASDEELQAE